MKQQEINWQTGNVVFWDLDSVNEAQPLSDQLSELKEDLAQIEYPGRLLLDVGWYPESDKDGGFVVVVVRDEAWDQPLMRERCSTVEMLRSTLCRAIRVAEGSVT